MRIQAPFVIVDAQRILTNAQIEIDQGRILSLCETPQIQPDLLLDNSVLLPGFINAHTHLEFSDLRAPIAAGGSFPSWIAAVIQRRQELAIQSSSEALESLRYQAIQLGYEECRSFGTALIVDIVTEPWCPQWLDDLAKAEESDFTEASRVIALAEVLGLERQRLEKSGQWARSLLHHKQLLPKSSTLLEIGVSPHATYSLLYPQIRNVLSDTPRQRLVAMHVAESLEERQWLEQSSGPFRDLFSRLGLIPNQQPMQVAQAIDLLSTHERSLLVHGNYLNAQELDAVAKHNMAVVYCPRTHQHFAHAEYPLQEIVRRDIPLLLGTDSRASSPDLNIWQECKTALQLHSSWLPFKAFDAITFSAAQFLGVEKNFGSLDVGKLAWINTIDAPAGATAANLLELLLSSTNSSKQKPLTLSNVAR